MSYFVVALSFCMSLALWKQWTMDTRLKCWFWNTNPPSRWWTRVATCSNLTYCPKGAESAPLNSVVGLKLMLFALCLVFDVGHVLFWGWILVMDDYNLLAVPWIIIRCGMCCILWHFKTWGYKCMAIGKNIGNLIKKYSIVYLLLCLLSSVHYSKGPVLQTESNTGHSTN